MKKLITSLLVLVLVLTCCVTILTSCIDNTNYDRTIIFYHTQGDSLQTLTAQAIASFEAKFPGWKVKQTQVGGYDDVKAKIVSDFQGQQQPDLAYCYPDHVAHYLETQKVIDLSKFVLDAEGKVANENGTEYTIGYSQEEIDDFVKVYYDEGYAVNFGGAKDYGYEDDALLTLPFVKSTELMFYNKDALDECGLEPAKTWDELWDQCEILKTRYPNCTPLGYDSDANWFITMCEQNGWGYTSADADHYLFDNADTRAWLEELHGYYEKGYVTTQEDYGTYTSNLFVKGAEAGGTVLYWFFWRSFSPIYQSFPMGRNYRSRQQTI